MEKVTKTNAKGSKAATTISTGSVPAPSNVAVLDIASLTPAQLAQLQKQLKEKNKVITSKKDERFAIIDQMLKDKDENGAFQHTTRDILNALESAKVVDTTAPDYDKVEIKKIQARKQFLEKKTNEKGELVSPKGTFGYKPSDAAGFSVTPARIVNFFSDPALVATLTEDQRQVVLDSLSE